MKRRTLLAKMFLNSPILIKPDLLDVSKPSDTEELLFSENILASENP
jgi:hypothetical protein